MRAAADESRAEALFREGRSLLADGRVADACDKFAESQNEQPSVGALLNLARCHTTARLTVSAWTTYLAAARLARAQGRSEQAAEAELRAAELEPRVMYLALRFEAPAPGMVVTRDGEPLSQTVSSGPVPVDPGNHVIAVHAPGYAPFVTTLRFTEPGQVRSLTIPALTPLQAGGAKRAEPADAATGLAVGPVTPAGNTRAQVETPAAWHVLPTESWIAVGIGTAALASSAVVAWVAKSKWDDAHEQGLCDSAHVCSDAGMSETAEARRLGNLATIGTVIGVASFVSAGLFYATARASRTGPVRAGVSLSHSQAGLELRGEF
jgi:hypothetical protein